MKFRAIIVSTVWLLAGLSVQAQQAETEMLRDAKQLYDSGRMVDAEKSFAKITREHPANVAAQMYLGQTLFKEEKFAEAIRPYELARTLEPVS
jgi:predicted Zn-dependent protease